MTATPDNVAQPAPLKALGITLHAVASLILLMAMIGAATRLTESGLSITEWRPVTGMMPPLSESDWAEAFRLYRDSPQFLLVNPDMDMAAFKHIFWWEWAHRFLGRAIGIAFLVPLVWGLASRQAPPRLKLALVGLFLLGGMQGVIGWLMVKTGLADRPSVSHFALAAHLLTALLLFSLMLLLGFALMRPQRNLYPDPEARRELRRGAGLGIALVAATACFGAFTAGLDGGMVYNSFPFMNGKFLPPELRSFPALLFDPGGVQFVHRWLAAFTASYVIGLWFASRRKQLVPAARRLVRVIALMACVQVFVGVSTLLLQVPLPLAVMHQGVAFLLLGFLTGLRFETRGA
jgi:cytochrome c oxidase assembly protein subunit 15